MKTRLTNEKRRRGLVRRSAKFKKCTIEVREISRATREGEKMSSTLVSGLGSAVSGMWRSHAVLHESEPDSSPEVPPQRRTRVPLRALQAANSVSVSQIKRTAKNSIGSMYQQLQRSLESHEECLVKTPGKIKEGEENDHAVTATRTPKRPPTRSTVTPKHTPRSTNKRTPEVRDPAVRAVRTTGTRRQLVRMAALKSPFASPNAIERRRQLDQDLDCVSKGLRKLKRLSQAFNDVIGRDDRVQAMEHYKTIIAKGHSSSQSSESGKFSRVSICQQSRRIRQRVGSWTDTALSNIRKAT